MKKMNAAIIGSGLQARRRGLAIISSKKANLAGIFSDNKETAYSLSNNLGCRTFDSTDQLMNMREVEVVIVCTPPDSHYQYAKMALAANKHVLVEKPFTQNSKQSGLLLEIARNSETILRCGFNHRFHPSLLELKKKIEDGVLGKIKYSRSLYGMGLRENYHNEWRANPRIAAGGQFMEQGSHLVDLMQFLMGNIETVFFKPMNSILEDKYGEDSGTALLTHSNGAMSNVTSTLLQWHNRFSVEIFGELGFAVVEGLGGSYGVETLKVGFNLPGQPFSSEIIEYRGSDSSWDKEWEAFRIACTGGTSICATPEEGHKVMKVIEAGYESAKLLREVKC